MSTLSACASDDGPAEGALDVDVARDRLAAACASTSTRLDGLADPIDEAQRSGWTLEVAAILRAEAGQVGAFTLLDEEQRDGFRAFADNTAAQAEAWQQLGELLGTGIDLSGDPRVGDLTTEIGELSLGRDELSDELGVAACRRG